MKPYQIHGEHEQAAIGNWPGGRNKVPGHVLDALAEQKLMGGYTRKRNPLCPDCNTRKAVNGTCFCM